MNASCFFPFTFLLLIHTVLVQSVPVEGVIGDVVLLPCVIGQNPKEVYWRFKVSSTVCDIRDGVADFDEQASAYTGRVEIFSSEFKKGNFSIVLRDVKESDAGPYTCHAPGISSEQKVELKVKERRTTTERAEIQTATVRVDPRNTSVSTSSRNGGSRRRADGLLTFLLGCALIYSSFF